MSELHGHCDRQKWENSLALFSQPNPPTIEQLLYKDGADQTALQLACLNGARHDLIAAALEQAGEDMYELCMVTDALLRPLLAAAACGYDDPAVHKSLISAFPLVLAYDS